MTRDELQQLGLSRHAIQARIDAGRLHRLHRSVYAVGHRALTWRGRWLAAVLACGPEALLSHFDGGAVWGIWRKTTRLIDVTVPHSGRRPRRGIRIHQTRHLLPEDRARRHGIPVTSVARTLLDMAAVLGPKVERAYSEAQRLGVFNASALARLLERVDGRPGAPALAALLAQDRAAVAFTKSDLEAELLAMCREGGLDTPLINVMVAGYEVDAYWPDARLVVELDSWAFHRTRLVFERDRERDAAVMSAGGRLLRLTHRMMTNDRQAVIETIRRLLASDRSAS